MRKAKRNILGPKIRYYRELQGITQEYLIARLNVQGIPLDRPMLSKIENQERKLYDYEIYAFAKALQLDFNDLFPKL